MNFGELSQSQVIEHVDCFNFMLDSGSQARVQVFQSAPTLLLLDVVFKHDSEHFKTT